MSCNGCRVLRKGCSENCMLHDCIEWMENPQSQARATLFVAKFFGRAGLLSFINAVSPSQRPALFQSLLFEAVGRTINPVNGATGLLLAGKWKVCEAAVETVLSGGALEPLPEYRAQNVTQQRREVCYFSKYSNKKRPAALLASDGHDERPELDLSLKASPECRDGGDDREVTPSYVEGSETSTFSRSGSSSADYTSTNNNDLEGSKLLRLFV